MIISVGIDLVEVERIRAALEHPRIGLRFRERVYTQREIAYCEKDNEAASKVMPAVSLPKKPS